MSARWLRILRVIVSVTVMTAITALFLIPSAMVAGWLAGFAAIQWMPSAVAFSLIICVGWLIVTLFFGRVYCSTVCPLGVMQDIVWRVRRLLYRRSDPPVSHHYSRPHSVARNSVLLLTLSSLVLGIVSVAALLDPFSAYGRICLNLISPPLRGELPWVAGTLLGCSVALITAAAVAAMAWRRGRLWCNTVCPVGTTLGYVSRHSIMRIDIDTDRCTQCRKCEWVCKSECIDLTSHVVDGSRCVNCFNCISVCDDDAIHYTFTRKQLAIPMMQKAGGVKTAATMDRRTFLMIGAATALSPLAARSDASLSARPRRPVCPPGIPSRELFVSRCTACGLCVAQCPTKVIRPSLGAYGLLAALHPMMDYDRSMCLLSCNRCTTVCPSGALTPLTIDERSRFIIGTAEVAPSVCIAALGESPCGLCEDVCPKNAVAMRDLPGGRRVPEVDPGLCVGCGACQYACPARPERAIVVVPLI